MTDGAGREFRLVLTHTGTACGRGPHLFAIFFLTVPALSQPQRSRHTLPGTEYGPDSIRLSAGVVDARPGIPEPARCATGAVHVYEAGELLAVYDRSNTQVRAFTYDAQHPGRMVAHRYAGRPEMRYRYDDAGRVVEQQPGRPELRYPV